MSWNSCKTKIFIPRTTFTSALFKVLLTLKLLHGTRQGARGSTLEDIAMHMIKHFCLDGDIKSQVLASLKYGVKMHFIQKKREKFSLILPASSIHLAPCKYKNEETERIQCIFPPNWDSNCNANSCGSSQSCCGRSKAIKRGAPACYQRDNDEDEESDNCDSCAMKNSVSSKNSCSYGEQETCSKCNLPMKKPKRRKSFSSACVKKKKKKSSCDMSNPFDNYCLMCSNFDDYEDGDNDKGPYQKNARINCRCCE